MFRRIYIASSWKNLEKVRALAIMLRSLGHEVFDFTDSDNRPKETDWFNCPADKWDGPPLATMEYKQFLTYETSQRIFTADMTGMHWADTVILYLPSGRSSHMEAGFAAGAGKDLFIYGDLPLGEFDPLYFFAKGCYHEAELPALLDALNAPGKVVCAWCQSPNHLSKDCPISEQDKMRRCFQAIADPLIEGDYCGPLRGEVNVCLNVIHYHKAFEQAALELLSTEKCDELRQRAYVIRAKNWGRLPW